MFKTTLVRAGTYLKKGLQTLWRGISHLAVSWPKAFAAAVALLVLSYYPLGGLLSENIDRTSDYNLTRESEQQSLTVETMRFLINREVNENLWTANLPPFFPSYFLDNMPNYQQGIVSALAVTASVIGEETQCPENGREKAVMNGAAELLKYPGNVWLFAPDNKLKIAPSSASQYRKARKLLRDYNRLLPVGRCFWARDYVNMRGLIKAVKRDLYKTAEKLETQIAEHSSDWTDFRADDLFYYSQGKIYAYMLILKAWGMDFKEVLLDSGQYENWTRVTRALEDGSALSPLAVRNGELNSGMAANHLVALGYYMLRAAGLLEQISYEMKGVSFNAD